MPAVTTAAGTTTGHEQCKVIRMLTDIRFKLLALVPTVRALNVVVSSEPRHEPTPLG